MWELWSIQEMEPHYRTWVTRGGLGHFLTRPCFLPTFKFLFRRCVDVRSPTAHSHHRRWSHLPPGLLRWRTRSPQDGSQNKPYLPEVACHVLGHSNKEITHQVIGSSHTGRDVAPTTKTHFSIPCPTARSRSPEDTLRKQGHQRLFTFIQLR